MHMYVFQQQILVLCVCKKMVCHLMMKISLHSSSTSFVLWWELLVSVPISSPLGNFFVFVVLTRIWFLRPNQHHSKGVLPMIPSTFFPIVYFFLIFSYLSHTWAWFCTHLCGNVLANFVAVPSTKEVVWGNFCQKPKVFFKALQ